MAVKRILEVTQFESAVTFFIPPLKYTALLEAGNATPDITNQEFVEDGGSAVTITDFLGGAEGQRLHILGRGTTTIADNSNIKTNTGANKLLASDKLYIFTYWSDDIWYEDA